MEKLYAYSLTDDNSCERIMPIEKLTDEEYKKLKAEQNELKRVKEELFQKQVGFIQDLQKQSARFEFILAKSIYDNFVDRGLLEDNVAFQNAWYEYVFNGTEIEVFPEEYLKIYAFVKGE